MKGFVPSVISERTHIEGFEDMATYDRKCIGFKINSKNIDLLKIIFLGAQGVGKTSIIQQFLSNHFNEKYEPTKKKQNYYTSVVFNGNIYELRISDLPAISHFPTNAFCEYECKLFGLRNATAYIFIFDLSNLESFQYLRIMRDHIAEQKDIRNTPMLVIGNKRDKYNNNNHFLTYARPQDALQREKLKEICNIVKKQWKCAYVDCSAKYNLKVVSVFHELIKIIDANGAHTRPPPTIAQREIASVFIENINESSKCVIS